MTRSGPVGRGMFPWSGGGAVEELHPAVVVDQSGELGVPDDLDDRMAVRIAARRQLRAVTSEHMAYLREIQGW